MNKKFRHNHLMTLISMSILAVMVASCKDDIKPNMSTSLKIDPNNDSLALPANFELIIAAEGVGKSRHMFVRNNGDIFVNLDSRKKDSALVALRDTNGDGQMDVIKYFDDYTGTGIAIEEPYLYASSRTEVFRYTFNGDELLPNLEKDTLIYGFETSTHHPKGFTFDKAGNIFVNVGAPSNACMTTFRTAESPGKDPCPELELNAGIWKFDKTKINQKHGVDGSRYATGIRNAMALDWSVPNGGLYAISHGRDQLNTLWPGRNWDDEKNAELPSEEFFKVEQGDDFGWPYCYHDRFQNKKVMAPEYGGDGQIIGRCEGVKDPLIGFPAHWAPMDLLFYTGNMFPERYKNGAFIAFHGSWNRAPLEQKGHRVVFVPFENGQLATDKWEDFATGFPHKEHIASSSQARYRPVGLAQGPDGSLYITDSKQGRIWRIVYRANQ